LIQKVCAKNYEVMMHPCAGSIGKGAKNISHNSCYTAIKLINKNKLLFWKKVNCCLMLWYNVTGDKSTHCKKIKINKKTYELIKGDF
jgi:hypothetical protein